MRPIMTPVITSPFFEDEDQKQIADALNALLIACFVSLVLLIVALPIISPEQTHRVLMLVPLALLVMGMLYLLKHGHIWLAGLMLSGITWGAITISIMTGGGIHSISFSTYIIAIIISGFLQGKRIGMIMAALSAIVGLGLVLAENNGVLLSPRVDYSLTAVWAIHTTAFFITAVVLYLLSNTIHRALFQAHQSKHTLTRQNHELERQAKTLNQAKRAYKMLSECHQAAIDASEETEFLQQACHLIFKEGGYWLVSIGLADPGKDKQVRLVAQAGYEEEHPEAVNTIWANIHELGPIRVDMQAGQPGINHNILINPGDKPWHAKTLQHDCASSLILPLITPERTLGTLNIYASESDAFDKPEVELLIKLAAALSYGISMLRIRKAHMQAEKTAKTCAQQQAVVAKLGQAAWSPTDLHQFMDHMITSVTQTLQAEYCQVLEFLPGSHALHLRAGIGWQTAHTDQMIMDVIPGSYASYALQAAEPLIIEDLHTETRFSNPSLFYKHNIVSGLSVIIAGQKHPFGILGIYTARQRTFTQDDAHFLQSVANTLAATMERRKADTELHKLSRAIEQCPVSIIITDIDSKIEYVNTKFTQVTGYTLQDVMGKNPNILQSGETSPQEYARLWETISAGGEWQGEFRNKKKSGKVYWEWATISAINDMENNITHFLSVQQDITNRKSMEAHVQQQARLAAVGQLAAGIAHDFNNLLTPIHLYTEMAINSTPEHSRIRSHLEQVIKAADRARNLVQNILVFSRKEAEQDRQSVQIHSIINDVLELLKVSLPGTIQVHQNINARGEVIMANPTQIHQVIMNLCMNAYQAMSVQGGLLSIALDIVDVEADFTIRHPNLRSGAYIKVTVSDTGHGMDQATMAQIFDPFFTTKAVGEGTGMGLSVAYGIVTNHGGDIIVASEPGKGTVFSVYLPQFDKTVAVASRREQLARGGRERILLVDDEEAVAVAVKQSLEHLGYDVTMVNSSLLALKTFYSQPNAFDLVITDQTMPDMTGVQLSHELLCIRPDLPIILITGFSETTIPEQTSKMGLQQCLMKPFAVSDLDQIIHKVLDNKNKDNEAMAGQH